MIEVRGRQETPQRLPALMAPLLVAAAGALAWGGCSGNGSSSEPAVGTEPSVDPAAVAALVTDAWARAVANDVAGLEALLDAPGGAGWLDLFHGDLRAAEVAFAGAAGSADPSSSSARLGLARVHLARAQLLRETGALHAEVALELARYRRDHASQVRPGAYDLIAAALAATSQPAADPVEAEAFLDAAVAGIQTDRPGGDLEIAKALTALAVRRRGAADPMALPAFDSLPEPYRGRIEAAHAIAGGDRDAARGLASGPAWRSPDFVDPRGVDGATGLRFESDFRDALPILAAARLELADAWVLAAGIEGPGLHVRTAVELAWGGPLPESLRAAIRPPSAPLPAWTGLFGASAVDPADWSDAWGGDGPAFADRWAEVHGIGEVGDPIAFVDANLRDGEGRRAAILQGLIESATEAGATVVTDLDLAQMVLDRVYRTQMERLMESGQPAHAKRLGDRSLDHNPGSRGGPENSKETRISYRNDAAFIVSLARCLHRAGQTGAALAHIHPLAREDARMLGVEHYLGRLDAAGSIGTAGKAAQL